MKLQHYLGGLEGLGRINFEKRVFVQPWEKRIFGIHVAMMALSQHLEAAKLTPTQFKSIWTWANLRKLAEGMNPFDYFKYRYYEKWLGGISSFFIESGYISTAELETKTEVFLAKSDTPLPHNTDSAIDNQVIEYLRVGDSPKCKVEDLKPKFSVGDTVTIKNPLPTEHCKLPGYLRNKQGVIETVYEGAYNYPLQTGDGVGDPMPIYSIKFDSHAIWGNLTEPKTWIYADIYEAYIENPN